MASTNSKRIAKNTMFLYMRMFLTMCISIYTSRILLAGLGVINYGIYNVVGGVIGMLAFLNGSLASSSQRFLTYSIGRGDDNEVSQVFSHVILIHFLLAVIVVILAESLGIWLLNTQLNIPEDRMFAANVAFQLSVFTMAISIICVPYNALVIAYERMSFFAYISIYEVVMKLLVAFSISYFAVDKLILYAILITFTQLTLRLVYGLYCTRNFKGVKFRRSFSKNKIKEIMLFVSWDTFASVAIMMMNQGTNIILNIFFGPVVNAARQLSQQVQHALTQLYTNFQMAINPQITKTYAQNNLPQMHSLMFASVKISFTIMYAIALPFFFECEYVLGLWLEEVPDYTAIFVKMGFAINVIDAISNPFIIGCKATGKIKGIMLICGTMFCMVLPITYVCFKMGLPPYYAYVSQFVISFLAFFVRLGIVDKLIRFDTLSFLRRIICPMIMVVGISYLIVYGVNTMLYISGFAELVIIGLLSVTVVTTSSYLILLNNKERSFVVEIVKGRLNKFRKVNKQ